MQGFPGYNLLTQRFSRKYLYSKKSSQFQCHGEPENHNLLNNHGKTTLSVLWGKMERISYCNFSYRYESYKLEYSGPAKFRLPSTTSSTTLRALRTT